MEEKVGKKKKLYRREGVRGDCEGIRGEGRLEEKLFRREGVRGEGRW